MRCFQNVGLTEEARKFLEENVKTVADIICPFCSKTITQKMDSKVYDYINMFYGDGPDLQEYKLKDGRVVKEVVQVSPWSGGPMAFLCLEIDGKQVYKWKDKDIEIMSGS